MICFLCNTHNLKHHIEKNGYTYYKCLNCGLIQQIPLPKHEEIKEIYDGEEVYFINENKGTKLEGFIKLSERERYFYSIMKEYLIDKKMRILDVGAGTGLMLAFLQKKKFLNLEGIELSSWACKVAKENFGLEFQNSDIAEVEYPSTKFDLVISNHVIEHLREALSAYKKINQFLKMGGILFLSTPNNSCFNSRLVKRKWRHYIPNEHIFLYNDKSLNFFLKKVGFEIIKVKKRIDRDINAYNYLKQLIFPIITDFIRKFKKQESLNNFLTGRDGIIIVAKKVKNI